ncbi:phosphopantetheine-binding protein, partial [Alteromonas sp. ASW11-130]|uniref:phosphopantetheine-binding protein n=1 Tax=Alteromonas sp. ASW11-130 TaxID=3015775 RepID=UPI00224257CA
TEKALEQIWQDVLRVNEPLSVTANFFHLGGHSLLAVQIISGIYRQWDLDLQIQQLFELQTISELAAFIEDAVVSRNALLMQTDNEELEEMEW